VSLGLPQDVEECSLQVRLTLDRTDARRLEAHAKPQSLIERDLDSPGALPSAQAICCEEHVQMGVGDAESEQPERVRHSTQGARRDATRRGARSDRAVVDEAEGYVMADGVVSMKVHRAGREASATPAAGSLSRHR
jgi:hypothetical protein